MRNETGSIACKMSTQDIEVDDASKSLVASWFSVRKDTESDANKKSNISPYKSDKKKKKKGKVVQSVDTLSSDEETTKTPDYSDGRRIDPYSIIKHTTSSFVGQKLDKKLRKAKYAKALQETDDTEKLFATEMRKKKAKGNNSDEDSEEDGKISMIDKNKQVNKERAEDRVQSYTVEVLEQKLTDSSLSTATKKRLKRKLAKLKAEKALADTKISQSVTEGVPTGDQDKVAVKDKTDSDSKKHKKKKKMLDKSSSETIRSQTMGQTQQSGDNDTSKLTEKMQKKKAKKHSHELLNFGESVPAKKKGKMSSFDSSSEDEITLTTNEKTKHLLETSTVESSFVKIKKKKKNALETSFEGESSSVKKKGQISEGEISTKSKTKKHSPEVKSPISLLKRKKENEIMDVSFEDKYASSEKKGKKRSIEASDEVQISPSKKKKLLTDSPSRPDGESSLLVRSSVIEELQLKLSSPDIHGKERKKLKNKLRRIRKRSVKKSGDDDKSVDEETEHSPCKKNDHKVEKDIPEPKASLVENVKNLLVGKEKKKKKHKKEGGEDTTDPLMSPQVQANSPEKTAADVNSLKKKKKRSKQKNIKKDNRPEHLKPAHLKT